MATTQDDTDPTDRKTQDKILDALDTLNKQRNQLANMVTEGQDDDESDAARLIKQAQEAIDAFQKVRPIPVVLASRVC